MLVLSRKLGEEIHIGNNIVIKINRVAGERVAIGISAPTEIRIVRGELVAQDQAVAQDPGVAQTPEVSLAFPHADASVSRISAIPAEHRCAK